MEEVTKHFNKIINHQPGKELIDLWASILGRINVIKLLIADMSIKKTGFDIGVVRIKKDATDLVVGTFYSYKGTAKYFNYSYTMISADGEFRPIFISWEQIKYVFNTQAERLELLEKETMKLIPKKNIYTVGYVPDKGLLYTIMSVALLLFVPQNPFLFNNRGVSLDIIMKQEFGKLQQIITGNNMVRYRNILTLIMPFLPEYHYRKFHYQYGKWKLNTLGHKLMPLTIYDLENIGTVNSKIWKELIITKKCEELLTNGCCEEFSFIPNWFITNKTNKNIFNNAITTHHYEKSEEILSSISNLYKSKKIEIISEYGNLYKDYINIPIKYAERHLVMTNHVFVMICEFRGKPVADYDMMFYEHFPNFRDYNIYNDVKGFKNMLFKFMYGLAAINRIGIIHGDLHLNNVLSCINQNLMRVTYDSVYKKKIVYSYYLLRSIYHMENKTYFIPSNVQHTIIDFSRSLIMPHLLKTLTGDYEEIIAAQNRSVINIFQKIMPEWALKNDQFIRRIFSSNQKSVYQILTATDIIFMIQQFKFHNIKKIKEPVIKSVNHLINYGMSWIKNQFKQLDLEVNHKVPNFNREYIFKHFTEFEKTIPEIKKEIASRSGKLIEGYGGDFMHRDTIKISGVYNLDNELKYNLKNYDKFPTLITKIFDEVEKKDWGEKLTKELKKIKENKSKDEINNLADKEIKSYNEKVRQNN